MGNKSLNYQNCTKIPIKAQYVSLGNDINMCDQIIRLLANKMIEQFVSLDYQLFENSRDFSTLD